VRFQELLRKLEKPSGPYGTWESPVFTMEDYESMSHSQLSNVILEIIKFVGVGSYMLRGDLFDLIDHLDKTVSIREDKHLEKYLHMTASLVCLTWAEGKINFNAFGRFARHFERIIGPDPIFSSSMEAQPSLQIGTFLAYPVLEGVVRRKLFQFISLEGKVLQEFTVDTKREKQHSNGFRPGYQERTNCKVKFDPKKRRVVNRLDDELRLLEQETKNSDLKMKLSYLDKEMGLFDEVQDWRWQLSHGVLTASWHSIRLLLLTYIILLEG
jgi:hypothetical protein